VHGFGLPCPSRVDCRPRREALGPAVRAAARPVESAEAGVAEPLVAEPVVEAAASVRRDRAEASASASSRDQIRPSPSRGRSTPSPATTRSRARSPRRSPAPRWRAPQRAASTLRRTAPVEPPATPAEQSGQPQHASRSASRRDRRPDRSGSQAAPRPAPARENDRALRATGNPHSPQLRQARTA
jgi:hypothetical protein